MAKRLTVVENATPGFFDPVSLASEIVLALKRPRSKAARSDVEERAAYAKAKSNRVKRARKLVLGEFTSKYEHITEDKLTRQCTANHPLCMHARLLGAMVRALYPEGNVYVHNDDAAWLVSRAPALPTVLEAPETSQPHGNLHGGGELIAEATDCPEGKFQDSAPVDNCSILGQDGDGLANNADTEASTSLAPVQRWWSDVTLDDTSQDFGKIAPPWDLRANTRLIQCNLPNSVRLTIDPASGLIRATDITSFFDKRLTYWLRLGVNGNDDSGTRGLANALANELSTTTNKLVYCVPRGARPCAWIHIQMVVSLAMWCSPAFSVHVSKLVMRYHSGQITSQESREAAQTLNNTMRAAVEDDVPVPEQRVPASSANHRLVRTHARQNSVRGPSDVCDIPIPRHLLTKTGVYIGAWGVVDDGTNAAWWHLKVGKACEQPVTSRVRSHYADRPYTFVLLFIAGCDGGTCHIVEAVLKHMAGRVLALEKVGNSDEEFKVPVPALLDTVGQLTREVCRRHRDILTLAEDLPIDAAVEKYRIDSEEKVKKYALDQVLKISDDQARARAIASILTPPGLDPHVNFV